MLCKRSCKCTTTMMYNMMYDNEFEVLDINPTINNFIYHFSTFENGSYTYRVKDSKLIYNVHIQKSDLFLTISAKYHFTGNIVCFTYCIADDKFYEFKAHSKTDKYVSLFVPVEVNRYNNLDELHNDPTNPTALFPIVEYNEK